MFVGREQCEKGARILNWARLKGDYVNVDSSDDRLYQWPILTNTGTLIPVTQLIRERPYQTHLRYVIAQLWCVLES